MVSGGANMGTFIDLFCGCGGFTLGMLRAGFDCVAAVDFDEFAAATLKRNLPNVTNVLQKDLTKYRPEELAELIGTAHVDVVVGGPPCQGFSIARSADGANHGRRLKADPRRRLYREFLKYVDHFQPKVFVMENVLGMRNAAEGEYFTRVHHEARSLGKARGLPGYRVHAQVEDARALGVPQKRRRQLIIGVRADLRGHFIPQLWPVQRAAAGATLGDAIGDLPILRADSGDHERDYNLKRRANHLDKRGETARNYLFNVLDIDRASRLTSHVTRPHSARDLRDFARLREGESSTVAIRDRGVKFEFPYDRSCFKDRYTRQSRTEPCSTIVAHLSKDGLMFIHPTQNRSLTPREVARVQSFPDWFTFPESRTRTYRMIGNAVPPLVAEAVGAAVTSFLNDQTRYSKASGDAIGYSTPRVGRSTQGSNRPPSDRPGQDLLNKLFVLVPLNQTQLRLVEKNKFLAGWAALFDLFPDIHPDNALDHGEQKTSCPEVARLFPKVIGIPQQRYRRSGWPVAFETFGREAWRRRNLGELKISEFYISTELGANVMHHSDKVLRE
jgi:DNA (cytosine-5)-methyltransferase 1